MAETTYRRLDENTLERTDITLVTREQLVAVERSVANNILIEEQQLATMEANLVLTRQRLADAQAMTALLDDEGIEVETVIFKEK